VALVGDFNDWARKGTPMTDPDENGVWTVSVPLQPGRYQYKFLVDGKTWVVEPDAPAYHPDGFGGRNSLLEI
jgi:1,4-alpha-glucan branching enzyme